MNDTFMDDTLIGDTLPDDVGGYIMQMQQYSVNDGEGIRTTVFMAGCPLRCAWCCNPEGITMKNPMTQYMTTSEVLSQIKSQIIFYRHSGGGVTFSGGEATMQPQFLRSMVNALYDMGINLALETCGAFAFHEVADILQKMDCVFMDIKHMNASRLFSLTGATGSVILENIKKVHSLSIPLVLRIPTIVGVNADQENMEATFRFIKSHAPAAKLEFLPYHRFGDSKYIQLGLPLPDVSFQAPDPVMLEHLTQSAKQYDIEVVSFR